MKTVILLILITLTAGVLRAQEDTQNEGTVWLDLTLDEGIKMSAETGKPLFIDCHTKTCGPCKYMLKNVFPLKEVGEYMNSNFICIKKDMEEGDGITVAKRYDVRLYPTYLIIIDGKEYCRMTSLVAPKDNFPQRMQATIDATTMKKEFENGKRNEDFLSRYIHTVKGVNNNHYQTAINEYLIRYKQDSLASAPYWQLFKDEIHKVELPVFQYVLANRQKLAKELGHDEVYHKLFHEYSEEFRMFSLMGLDYELRIPNVRLLEQDGITKATPLLYCMQMQQAADQKDKQKTENILRTLERKLPKFSDDDFMAVAYESPALLAVADQGQRDRLKNLLTKRLPKLKATTHREKLEEVLRRFR